jgi:hypothetical protein
MYREDRLAKAIWNRGTEVRLKRFLAKAKRGEGFTVGVVGGSGRSLYSILQLWLPFPTSRWMLTSWWGYITTHLTVGIHDYPPHGEPHGGDTLTTVSAGHGLHYNNIGKWSERETPLNMNRAIFNHLDSLFPAPGGQVIGEVGGNGKNGFVNGAQGGTGESSSLCILRLLLLF